MKQIHVLISQKKSKNILHKFGLPVLFILCMAVLAKSSVYAQDSQKIKGRVIDGKEEPVIGATIYVKGTTNGAVTNIDGEFSINPPVSGEQTLVVSFIGMLTREIDIQNRDYLEIILSEDVKQLEDVVVVGYGQQKRESVVGSITQTNSKVLERAGGVTNLGAALTGNLPGVITTSSTGMPGAEDPRIVIRAQTSWNNSDPLVLVDGIERSMNTVDISTVESVSVLKDASATAVYGVKGANGVILITTKRGSEGKASIQVRTNQTLKFVSKLPEKYDSYDALMLRNMAIERELPLSQTGWGDYTAMGEIYKYRYPANEEEWNRYPNTDWEEELFKDYALSNNTSVNVSGGTEVVKYFTSVNFVHEGDLFKTFQNGRGYKAGYGYNRLNVRSNLDFQLSKTTKFSTNLFGSNGVRKLPWGASNSDAAYWAAAYRTAPDAMRPVYSDGTWGWYAPRNVDQPNSVYLLAMSGVEKRTTTQINTDFILDQDLDFISDGLSFKANLSFDNRFLEEDRGINDLYNNAQRKWINPVSGETVYEQVVDSGTQLDHSDGVRWSSMPGAVNRGATFRKLYYYLQLYYTKSFGANEITTMGLFSREKYATGSEFQHFREDWVFRATYNYAMKYFIEANGAYNGSERFGPEYRFAFFPSISAGWNISEEHLVKDLGFIDQFKVRASWGKIGDDNINARFLYVDQWSYGGNTLMGDIPSNTPYTYYRISSLGNENISWETVEKRNIGIDYVFFNGLITGAVDFFNDRRSDILVSGNNRAIPSYFGAQAPVANLGIVESQGYEIQLNISKLIADGLRVWINSNMTHATNEVIFADDAELLPGYQKDEGYSIGQTNSYIDDGFLTSWDDIYGSTERTSNNNNKLPGDFNIVDFNADGVIDTYDMAPYGYTGIPQNTYNTTFGIDWKDFNFSAQFYGVSNVTRTVQFPTFHSTANVAYVEGTYFSIDEGGEIPLPRWTTTVGSDAAGTRYLYDGAYLRLKNVEIGYKLDKHLVNRFGMNSFRFYITGSNLWLWTKMPDDRESNFSGSSSYGAYPTVKRINLGLEITF